MIRISTEKKIIGGVSILTLIILMGGIFFFSGKPEEGVSTKRDDIVAENGLHWHPKLEIYINGKKQEIPENIGIGAVHKEIHTHEDATEGVLHMEMAGVVTKNETEIGNFFKTWGKDFSKDRILDAISGPAGKVKMFVNGEENFEFEKYRMKDNDMIEIRYE